MHGVRSLSTVGSVWFSSFMTVVICLTAGTGKYFTDETDAEGYAEVLVPVGQKYDITYLSLGRKDTNVAATVTVTNEPKLIRSVLFVDGHGQAAIRQLLGGTRHCGQHQRGQHQRGDDCC